MNSRSDIQHQSSWTAAETAIIRSKFIGMASSIRSNCEQPIYGCYLGPALCIYNNGIINITFNLFKLGHMYRNSWYIIVNVPINNVAEGLRLFVPAAAGGCWRRRVVLLGFGLGPDPTNY
jgi:hypothetical protein